MQGCFSFLTGSRTLIRAIANHAVPGKEIPLIEESYEYDFAFLRRLHRKQRPRKTSSRRFQA